MNPTPSPPSQNSIIIIIVIISARNAPQCSAAARKTPPSLPGASRVVWSWGAEGWTGMVSAGARFYNGVWGQSPSGGPARLFMPGLLKPLHDRNRLHQKLRLPTRCRHWHIVVLPRNIMSIICVRLHSILPFTCSSRIRDSACVRIQSLTGKRRTALQCKRQACRRYEHCVS